MKPSTRIYELIGKTSHDLEWQEKAIDAIIEYLDEEYYKNAPTECSHVFGTTGAQNHICMKCGEKDSSWRT